MSSFGEINRLNTNVYSMDAATNLNKVNRNLQATGEKLSTGKNTNSAEDDAVKVSISANLNSKIAGLEESLQYEDSGRLEDFKSESIIAHKSANSVAIDTDYAKQKSEMIRQKIMQETANSAMAQANISTAQVLGYI